MFDKDHLRNLTPQVFDGIKTEDVIDQHHNMRSMLAEFENESGKLYRYPVKGYAPKAVSAVNACFSACGYDFETVSGTRNTLIDSIITMFEGLLYSDFVAIRDAQPVKTLGMSLSARQKVSAFLALCYTRSPRFVYHVEDALRNRRLRDVCPSYSGSAEVINSVMNTAIKDTGLVGVLGCMSPAAEEFNSVDWWIQHFDDGSIITNDSPISYVRHSAVEETFLLPLTPWKVFVAGKGLTKPPNFSSTFINRYTTANAERLVIARDFDQSIVEELKNRSGRPRFTEFDSRLINKLNAFELTPSLRAKIGI